MLNKLLHYLQQTTLFLAEVFENLVAIWTIFSFLLRELGLQFGKLLLIFAPGGILLYLGYFFNSVILSVISILYLAGLALAMSFIPTPRLINSLPERWLWYFPYAWSKNTFLKENLSTILRLHDHLTELAKPFDRRTEMGRSVLQAVQQASAKLPTIRLKINDIYETLRGKYGTHREPFFEIEFHNLVLGYLRSIEVEYRQLAEQIELLNNPRRGHPVETEVVKETTLLLPELQPVESRVVITEKAGLEALAGRKVEVQGEVVDDREVSPAKASSPVSLASSPVSLCMATPTAGLEALAGGKESPLEEMVETPPTNVFSPVSSLPLFEASGPTSSLPSMSGSLATKPPANALRPASSLPTKQEIEEVVDKLIAKRAWLRPQKLASLINHIKSLNRFSTPEQIEQIINVLKQTGIITIQSDSDNAVTYHADKAPTPALTPLTKQEIQEIVNKLSAMKAKARPQKLASLTNHIKSKSLTHHIKRLNRFSTPKQIEQIINVLKQTGIITIQSNNAITYNLEPSFVEKKLKANLPEPKQVKISSIEAFLTDFQISIKSVPPLQNDSEAILKQGVALLMGNKFSMVKGFYENLKSHLNTTINPVTFELKKPIGKPQQQVVAEIYNLTEGLCRLEFLKNHHYVDSPENFTITAELNRISKTLMFLSGQWLEIFVKEQIILSIRKVNPTLKYSYLLNPKVTLPNGEDFEFDILFKIAEEIFWFEAKTANSQSVQDFVAKYSRISSLLGLDREHAFVIVTDLSETAADSLSEKFNLTVVNVEQFADVFEKSISRYKPQPATPP